MLKKTEIDELLCAGRWWEAVLPSSRVTCGSKVAALILAISQPEGKGKGPGEHVPSGFRGTPEAAITAYFWLKQNSHLAIPMCDLLGSRVFLVGKSCARLAFGWAEKEEIRIGMRCSGHCWVCVGVSKPGNSR